MISVIEVARLVTGKRKGAAGAVLSPLEERVMCVLWNGTRDMKVREVHSKIGKKVALTSVAVILDRLHDKGLVKRRIETGKGGMHYIYSPAATEEDFKKSVIDAAVNKLLATFGPVAASYFNERFSKKKGQ